MPSRSILSRQLGYLIPIHSCYNINAFGNLSYVLYSCYLLLWPNHSWLTAPYQLLERNAANFGLRKRAIFNHKTVKIRELTIRDSFLQTPTWGWSALCKCHLQNTQRVHSKGWRAPETKGRRTLEKGHCSPGCKGNTGPGSSPLWELLIQILARSFRYGAREAESSLSSL